MSESSAHDEEESSSSPV
jgi:hypothetical protein